MKLTIDKKEDTIALLKQAASSNRVDAMEAQAAIAQMIEPVINEVINVAKGPSGLFSKTSVSDGTNASLPLDLFHDITSEDEIKIWSQTEAGGLASNEIQPIQKDLRFRSYTYDSAYMIDKSFLKAAQVDILAKAFTRIMQEILLIKDKSSMTLILKALSAASTNSKQHVFRSETAGALNLDDFNNIVTRAKRINTAWNGGTPDGASQRGITDLMISPELFGKIRKISWTPVHTGTKSDIPAHEKLREDLYDSAGLPSFFGINMVEMNELGVGFKYNDVFDAVAGATAYTKFDGTGSAVFNGATSEIAVGVNRNKNSLHQISIEDSDRGVEFTFEADDQFSARSKKIGWFGEGEEARLITDDRALMGFIL